MMSTRLSPLTLYLSCGVVMVLLVAGGYWFWPASNTVGSTPASTAVPVQTAQVEQRDVPVLVRSVGQVRSLRSIEIRPQVDGELVEVLAVEGDHVKSGDLLARIDDRAIKAQLEQARAQLNVVGAQLDAARTELRRYRSLLQRQAVSSQTLDQQQALVAELEASLKVHQATVAANEVQLGFTLIKSPVDGRVGIHDLHAGSYVRASDGRALFSVVQLDPISVEAALPQQWLPQLRALLTETHSVTPVEAYERHDGTRLGKGQLAMIDNRVSGETGTIRVRATFANPEGQLWPDQSVVIDIQTEMLSDALTIPRKAVRQGLDGSYLWLVEDGKAQPRDIKILHADKDTVVAEGISAGEHVVVDGHSRLQRGVAVREQRAAANLATQASRSAR